MAVLNQQISNTGAFIRPGYNASYSTVHNAGSGTIYNYTYVQVGQYKYIAGATFTISRAFLYFDTSSLPSGAIITDVKLRIMHTSKDGVDFNIIVRNGQPTYPSDTLLTSDYAFSKYSGNGGSINTADMTPSVYSYLTFNYIGREWVNRDGVTKLALLSSRDISSTEPDAHEYIQLNSEDATYPAFLDITYYEESGIPTVTTSAATSLKANDVAGNGNITDAGGVCTERGFEYGTSAEPMWAVREQGGFIAGAFSLPISGLLPETTYYYRAFVTNSYDTAYGDWVSFTTTASPSYGIYEEANTASYRLYVSDDEAIAWMGYKGPYSGKQTLINITDITNKTKGGKVLKILPDAKGTFHVCITVKQELKS